MWIKITDQKPPLYVEIFFFGKVNVSTEHETKSKFKGYKTDIGLIDDYGDSIDGVEPEFWWDWSKVENPE